MKKIAFIGALMSCVFSASAAVASPACTIIAPAKVESLLGMKIASMTPTKGVLSEACSYLTAPGPRGPIFFVVERYTIAIPPGKEVDLMMKTSDSVIVPIAGLGDSAAMDTATYELVMRKGADVYKVNSRGMVCEKAQPGEMVEEAKAKCLAKHSAVLKQAAGFILSPAK
jgi:hypothetical protein